LTSHVTNSFATAPIPAKCKAYGPGLEKAEAKIPTHFTIESINARNTRCPCGGHPWNVKIKDGNGNELIAAIEDNSDGTYTVKYTPKAAGKLTIAVTLFDKHIPHSAFSVPVSPAGNF
jgi:filamin